jgi:opacity protein-like surface antigen
LNGFILSAALAGAAASAVADGIPQGMLPPRDCAKLNGFYVGGNIGSAQLTARQNNLDGYRNFDTPTSFTPTNDALTGGIQTGFNLQMHCSVFGVEADWNWAQLNGNTDPFPNTAFVTQDDIRTSVRSFGTLRTRSGIVVDNTLLYLTGGLAWADIHSNVDFVRIAPGVPTTDHFSWTNDRMGWTVGAGR